MDTSEWARQALASFDQVLAANPALRPRPGQRLMAEQVALTFSQADLGPPPEAEDGLPAAPPQRSIAVIQAGTGVGKSLAYCVPAIALALQRNTRVLISTASVALQEQLVHKDLPALQALLAQPFRFALAKGRGRYVCKLKLERRLGPGAGAAGAAGAAEEDWQEDDLFEPAPGGASGAVWAAGAAGLPQANGATEAGAGALPGAPSLGQQSAQVAYARLAADLASGRWDGDLDTLAQPLAAGQWQAVAAQASSCAARHCPVYGQCSYFAQRKALVGAQVIVVNHDLLLSTLGSHTLPGLEQSLLVIDEAHHLPAKALEQFGSRMDLSRLGWIERLTQGVLKAAATLDVPELADWAVQAQQLRQGLQELARQVQLQYGAQLQAAAAGARGAPTGRNGAAVPAKRDGAAAPAAGAPWGAATGGSSGAACVRVPQAGLPEALLAPLAQVVHSAGRCVLALGELSKALRAEMREQPQQAHRLATQYAQLGTLAPRLEAVLETAQRLQQPGIAADSAAAPEAAAALAKWFSWEPWGDEAVLLAHASPTLPGQTLRQHLWGAVRAAVLTSATLSSCNRFDFFMQEAGLATDPDARALEVPSPFDFQRQGRLVLATTRADPKDAAAFNAELVQTLLQDLANVRHGALVLFTSRQQMRLACEALPLALRPIVLVQNDTPRQRLLRLHAERVAAGQPSIIFGMQSFGEGLDLPGRLCEDLFITKLPFAPPDDPVGQARAEWLRAAGRDPFQELVLPAAAIRLAQWVGRAIRTEDDRAQVYCYDRRLHQSRFGQQLLAGLPPFERVLRPLQSAFAPL